MTSEEIVEKVKASLTDAIQDTALPQGDAVIFVAPGCLQKVAAFLKDDPSLKFDYLSDVSGVDYLNEEREPRFEAVYLLYSIDHQHSIRVRVGIDEDNPSVPTVSKLWKGALYPEQELFQFGNCESESSSTLWYLPFMFLRYVDSARPSFPTIW